jgi:hypothetical protein
MAKRNFCEFKDYNGRDWLIEIYDEGFTGDAVALSLGAEGFVLSWDGATDTTHDTIVGSSCSVPLIFANATDAELSERLREAPEGDLTIRIFRAATIGGAADDLHWAGVIICDAVTLDEYYPQSFDIEATDDLGLLDEIKFKSTPTAEYTDSVAIPKTITRILGKLRSSDAWGATDTLLKCVDNFRHADTATPYVQNTIIPNLKLRNVDDYGDAQYFTCKEILNTLLRNMGARLFLSAGRFWLQPITARFSSTTYSIYNFDKAGDFDGSPDLTPGEYAVTQYISKIDRMAVLTVAAAFPR